MFNKLYKYYKRNFDLELQLFLSKKTYAELEKESQDDEWF